MSAPGPLNLITDVAGLKVGNAEDPAARTGVTVLLPDAACVAGVDVRGGAPGTRETDLLRPDCRVERIDAIAFAGGSAFGLAAADGVVEWLRRAGRGFPIAGLRVPLVPGAIIFDFPVGGARDWPDGPPYWRLGLEAAGNAAIEFTLGNVGAGLGARAGGLKGGLGSASAVATDGLTVGALAVVNAVGSAAMLGGTLWAWDLEQAGEMGRQRPPAAAPAAGTAPTGAPGANTTLAVVATDLALDKAAATRLAIMAHDGLARALRPSHTPSDGDTVFALATGRRARTVEAELLGRAGAMAADCLARAIARGIFEAESLGGFPAYRERHPDAFGAP
jgi:L-aminopeptidase/D-esterase-like protein